MVKINLQLFATAEKQTVHSGHTIYLMINNVKVGKAQGIDGERSFGTEGVYEIGSIMPQEHIYNRYEGSLSIEKYFVKTNDLKAAGVASLGEDVLKKDIITIQVTDKYTGKIIRSYHGCSIVTYRETFRVNAIAGENATFVYLEARDGSSTSGGTTSRSYTPGFPTFPGAVRQGG